MLTEGNAHRRALLALIGICVALRLLRAAFCFPMLLGDSQSYLGFAEQIRALDLSGYEGARTPGYPLLLALTGCNLRLVELVQSLLGIGLSALLFLMVLRQTASLRMAFVTGLLCTLSLPLLMFEGAVMSETLSTFLIVLSLFAYQRIAEVDRPRLRDYLLLSFAVCAAGLTRPFLYFLAPLYLIVLLLRGHRGTKPNWAMLGAYLIPVVILLGGWCTFNWVQLGYFGPTTFTGYNLSQHSGGFIERAPDEYADIRDIYLEHRPADGDHSMTIWLAEKEMRDRTGMSMVELSRALTRMSVGLFLRHPLNYARSVHKAWARFWDPEIRWQADPEKRRGLTNPFAVCLLDGGWIEQRRYIAAANALFLLIALWTAYLLIRRRVVEQTPAEILALLIVLVASVLQALTEYGENGRYAIPFQPLVFYVVSLWLWRLWHRAKGSTSTCEPEPPVEAGAASA